MSRKQRRNHDVVVGADDDGAAACVECGDPIHEVVRFDRSKPVAYRRTSYWRHHRRWSKRPA